MTGKSKILNQKGNLHPSNSRPLKTLLLFLTFCTLFAKSELIGPHKRRPHDLTLQNSNSYEAETRRRLSTCSGPSFLSLLDLETYGQNLNARAYLQNQNSLEYELVQNIQSVPVQFELPKFLVENQFGVPGCNYKWRINPDATPLLGPLQATVEVDSTNDYLSIVTGALPASSTDEQISVPLQVSPLLESVWFDYHTFTFRVFTSFASISTAYLTASTPITIYHGKADVMLYQNSPYVVNDRFDPLESTLTFRCRKDSGSRGQSDWESTQTGVAWYRMNVPGDCWLFNFRLRVDGGGSHLDLRIVSEQALPMPDGQIFASHADLGTFYIEFDYSFTKMPHLTAAFAALNSNQKEIPIQISGDCLFHAQTLDPYEQLKNDSSLNIQSSDDELRALVIEVDSYVEYTCLLSEINCTENPDPPYPYCGALTDSNGNVIPTYYYLKTGSVTMPDGWNSGNCAGGQAFNYFLRTSNTATPYFKESTYYSAVLDRNSKEEISGQSVDTYGYVQAVEDYYLAFGYLTPHFWVSPTPGYSEQSKSKFSIAFSYPGTCYIAPRSLKQEYIANGGAAQPSESLPLPPYLVNLPHQPYFTAQYFNDYYIYDLVSDINLCKPYQTFHIEPYNTVALPEIQLDPDGLKLKVKALTAILPESQIQQDGKLDQSFSYFQQLTPGSEKILLNSYSIQIRSACYEYFSPTLNDPSQDSPLNHWTLIEDNIDLPADKVNRYYIKQESSKEYNLPLIIEDQTYNTESWNFYEICSGQLSYSVSVDPPEYQQYFTLTSDFDTLAPIKYLRAAVNIPQALTMEGQVMSLGFDEVTLTVTATLTYTSETQSLSLSYAQAPNLPSTYVPAVTQPLKEALRLHVINCSSSIIQTVQIQVIPGWKGISQIETLSQREEFDIKQLRPDPFQAFLATVYVGAPATTFVIKNLNDFYLERRQAISQPENNSATDKTLCSFYVWNHPDLFYMEGIRPYFVPSQDPTINVSYGTTEETQFVVYDTPFVSNIGKHFILLSLRDSDSGLVSEQLFQIQVDVLPCPVKVFKTDEIQPNQIFSDENPQEITFQEFQAIFNCDGFIPPYTITYALSALQGPQQEYPEKLAVSDIGSLDEFNFASIDQSQKKLKLQASKETLKAKKEWIVYISAKFEYGLEQSKLFDPIYKFLPPFKIYFTDTLKYVNQPPTFFGSFKEKVELQHGQDGYLSMGDVIDPEKDPIQVNLLQTIDEVTGTSVDWIKLVSEDSDGNLQNIIFQYKVPTDVRVSYEIFIILNVKDEPQHPLGKTASSNFRTIAVTVSGTKSQDFGEEKDQQVDLIGLDDGFFEKLIGQEIDKTGTFEFGFEQDIRVSNFLKNLTSENYGNKYISLQYQMSDTTIQSISDRVFTEQDFIWYVSDLLPNSMKITISWKFPEQVTKSFNDKDRIKISIKNSSIFIDHKTGVPLNFTVSVDKSVPKIVQQREYEQIQLLKKTTVQPLQTFVFIQLVLGSPFLSIFIQYLWGFINGLQIMVLIVLFIDNQMPRNVIEVLNDLFKLTTLDLLQIENFYAEIFHFPESESFSEQFDKLDIQGSVFFMLIGEILLLFLATLICIGLHACLKYVVKNDQSVPLKLRRYAQQNFYEENIVRFFLEAAIELMISTWISMASFSSHFGQFWDAISQITALAFTVVLIGLPFYIWHVAGKYNAATHKEAAEMGSGQIFSSLKRRDVNALRYMSIFILRRYTLMTVIMAGQMYPNALMTYIQIVVHFASTTYIIGYIMEHKPFIQPIINRQEVFNELCIIFGIYTMFVFTDWVDDFGSRTIGGWVFLTIIGVNFLVNIGILLSVQLSHLKLVLKVKVTVFKQKWRKFQDRRKQEKEEKKIAEKVKQEEKIAEQTRLRQEQELKVKEDIQRLTEISEEISAESSKLSFDLDNYKNEALIEELVGRGVEYREHEQIIGRFLKNGRIHKVDEICQYDDTRKSQDSDQHMLRSQPNKLLKPFGGKNGHEKPPYKKDNENFRFIETRKGTLKPNPHFKDPQLKNLPVHPDIQFLDSPRENIVNDDQHVQGDNDASSSFYKQQRLQLNQIVEEFKVERGKSKQNKSKEKTAFLEDNQVVDYIEGWQDLPNDNDNDDNQAQQAQAQAQDSVYISKREQKKKSRLVESNHEDAEARYRENVMLYETGRISNTEARERGLYDMFRDPSIPSDQKGYKGPYASLKPKKYL